MVSSKDSIINRIKKSPAFNSLFFSLSLSITVFISIGFYFFIDMMYGFVFKSPDFNNDDRIILKPYNVEDIALVANKDNKIIETNYSLSDSYINDKRKIEVYYKNEIDKNIKSDSISDSNNICKIDYVIKDKTVKILICDDYVFRRDVELALKNVKDYKSKIDTSSENIKSIGFEYLK